MMRRLLWPLIGTLLLEGLFLGMIWWAVLAAATVVIAFCVCEAVKAHRAQDEFIARFNDEYPPKPPDGEGNSALALNRIQNR